MGVGPNTILAYQPINKFLCIWYYLVFYFYNNRETIMMKKILIIGLSCVLIGAGIVFLVYSPFLTATETVKIAIFTPTVHTALEEVEKGFKETMERLNSRDYRFTTFNANGNRTLLRAQAEEIVSGNYDLVFTIGAFCSQTIAELLHRKNKTMPQVFGAIDAEKIAQALHTTNKGTTGVYVGVDYAKQMDILHTLKPDIENVLLVYDPAFGAGLEEEKQLIQSHLAQKGVQLHSVEIYQTNEIQQKVAALLPQMDVVLVLIDNTVVAGIDALITLCNRYGVTLMVSDLASGKKGASLAYGITEYESGSGAATIAHEILVDGKLPHDIPIRAVTNFRLSVNEDTMQAQNAQVDISLLEQGEQA